LGGRVKCGSTYDQPLVPSIKQSSHFFGGETEKKKGGKMRGGGKWGRGGGNEIKGRSIMCSIGEE